MIEWQEWELEYIKDNYSKLSVTKIAEKLNCTPRIIYGVAKKLKLKNKKDITKEFYYFLRNLTRNFNQRQIIILTESNHAEASKFNPNPYGITSGCNVVIGRNELGLRRFDYSRVHP